MQLKMAQKGLTLFFENFLEKERLLENPKVLQSNYTPDLLCHRDDQIKQIAEILAPALKLNKPSNVFIYGKTGTGKTVTIDFTSNQMLDVASKRDIPLKILYVNCKLKKVADTEYRLIAHLCRELGQEIPITGLPTDEVYKIFFNLIDSDERLVLLVLDEIDQLVAKAGDEAIYNLTRINSELKKSQISLVGISNDIMFANNLDPRIKSSLSEEELVFPPYNAVQIQDILKQRAKEAFKKEVLEQGLIEKCAAYAAREHGDARRALELMRVAGEIAERKGSDKVLIKHLDDAEEKIEKDKTLDIIRTQPKQFHAVLYSILSLHDKRNDIIFTGEVYDLYKGICLQSNIHPLTQRRVSDIVAELDMLGIINAKVISKGRYGRTREITISLPMNLKPKINKIIKDVLDI
jgi:cell division control protein 6